MPVSGLTLKQLRAIRQVHRTGRISAAAAALNITQSAVSVLIRQAETALDTRLFDRTTRALAPTEAAETIIGMVDRILADIDTLEDTVRSLGDLTRGQVRLTATPATGLTLLPPTVRRFRAAYPGVALVLDDCAPDQFFANIRGERADFGIGTHPVDRALFDWQPLHEDPLHLICPADHPFAARAQVAWAELAEAPLILSRRDYGVRGLVEETLRQQGVRPVLAAEVGVLGSAAWMTVSGIGLGILPALIARSTPIPGLATVPLTDPVVTRPAGVVTPRTRKLSPAAAAFVEMLAADLERA